MSYKYTDEQHGDNPQGSCEECDNIQPLEIALREQWSTKTANTYSGDKDIQKYQKMATRVPMPTDTNFESFRYFVDKILHSILNRYHRILIFAIGTGNGGDTGYTCDTKKELLLAYLRFADRHNSMPG